MVWVPIDTQGNTVLREIASKASLAQCRDVLVADPVRFAGQHQMRQAEIAARLRGGLLPGLCEVVRDLRARDWGTALGVTEQSVLRKTSRMLCDEWAAADGVSRADAQNEIEDLLREGSVSWIPRAGERRQAGIEFADW
jgi:RNA polymerase-interacting CarD/CdnL/TRCF family regulator